MCKGLGLVALSTLGPVAHIHAHQQPGDVTWILPEYMRVPYLYYDHAQTQWTGVRPQMSDHELEGLLRSSRRVWLVYQTFDVQVIDPTHRIERWLQQSATPSLAFEGFRVTVRLWTAD